MSKKNKKDQDVETQEIEKACKILSQTMVLNRQVEQSLWPPVLLAVLVNGFLLGGMTRDEFCKYMDEAKEHYSSWWE